MDRYSLERWTLERHHQMVRTAEDRARLRSWKLHPTLARRLAVHLRLLADRLDGRTTITVVSGSR
ncbi:MAG TPA: hypothetical protein VFO75_02230 [Candidatus Dormibacteraeota bacterium]|nr:hypothetical protein [Candidatus Dormibacteraeota bacterium]